MSCHVSSCHFCRREQEKLQEALQAAVTQAQDQPPFTAVFAHADIVSGGEGGAGVSTSPSACMQGYHQALATVNASPPACQPPIPCGGLIMRSE
jgi:hypothetical protein